MHTAADVLGARSDADLGWETALLQAETGTKVALIEWDESPVDVADLDLAFPQRR